MMFHLFCFHQDVHACGFYSNLDNVRRQKSKLTWLDIQLYAVLYVFQLNMDRYYR